ncbi:hypothetical protein H6F96_20520 [Microcoleus sp. FACHB-53]|jgi:uncharacterized protein YjbI with pentapeptide repeats|nr:hypothetical protein [Microcoleus sp. FACHB-53]
MKKSLLAIAFTTGVFTLAFSGQANADGWHLNGIRFNGMKFQGTTMQATKLQGMELQNLKVEGGQLVAVTRVAAE